MPAEGALCDGGGTGVQLIETLGWQRDAGFVRLDRHLARLTASATQLGFACRPQDAVAALHGCVHGRSEPQRVRLTLDPDGAMAATATPMTPTPTGTVWRVAIASTRLSSSDPLLRHKTSRRAAYDAARAEFAPDAIDEVLLLNERGELCEGTITTLFLRGPDGVLLTPPLSCGLLAGVLRAEQLATGAAREAIVTPSDLAGTAFFVGNSLRGLIAARLARPLL